MGNKRVRNAVLGCNLKNDRMISVRFQGKPFNITVIQVYAPTGNTEEAEVEWFLLLLSLIFTFIIDSVTILLLFYVSGPLSMRHAGSSFPEQGSNLQPLRWKAKS